MSPRDSMRLIFINPLVESTSEDGTDVTSQASLCESGQLKCEMAQHMADRTPWQSSEVFQNKTKPGHKGCNLSSLKCDPHGWGLRTFIPGTCTLARRNCPRLTSSGLWQRGATATSFIFQKLATAWLVWLHCLLWWAVKCEQRFESVLEKLH